MMRFSLLMLISCCSTVFAVDAAEPIGWRTDGTGRYPMAQPPLAWSPQKNVVWKTAMPGASNSLPVLLGERMFVCAEPCTLLCLDQNNGKILWQKNSSFAELDIEPAVRERLREEQAAAEAIDKQRSALNRESEALRRQLKEEPAMKLAIEKKLDEIQGRIADLQVQKQKLTLAQRYTERGKQPTAGYSSPTPITNGQEVFAAFGNGLAACFDLEGKRKWLKLIEQSTAPFAHGSSPVLVDGKVVVHFADLVALDARTGAECWRVKMKPMHGTSVASRVGDVDVVVTPGGMVVRASDGVVLAEGLGMSGANSPVLADGVVYFVKGTVTAVRLIPDSSQSIKTETLWKERINGGGYWFPSPVVHGGLLYALDDRGIFSVLDARTGKLVYEQRFEAGGRHYPSVSLAGDHVYLSSDNGVTAVVAAGREFKLLAENELETFRSSLVFSNNRMYVRTSKNLWCIGL